MERKYIGTCAYCKNTIRKNDKKMASCPNCTPVLIIDGKFKGFESRISFKVILGYVSDHVCDSKCTHAKGHTCECSCGGANHGSAWG